MAVYKESAESVFTAVESVLAQTLTDFELIIVNDNPGSSKTEKILQEISMRDDRVIILTNDKNRGLGYSLNSALKVAAADLVARMDTEDSSSPDRFEKQLAHFSRNSKVDLLFTQWIDVDELGNKVSRKPLRSDFAMIKKSFFIKSLLMHPTLLARKEVLTANPYPEMDRPEDFVLWLKLIREGYVFDLLEEPLYFYMADRIALSRRFEKAKKGSENILPHLKREARYYWKNAYFWLFFLRILFEYAVTRNELIFRLFFERAVRIWKRIFGC